MSDVNKLVCPADAMLCFDLLLGQDSDTQWGYSVVVPGKVGVLTGLQTNTGIEHVLLFFYDETYPDKPMVWLNVLTSQVSYQSMRTLLKRDFLVTVDNVSYSLGVSDVFVDDENHLCAVGYSGNQVHQLSKIMKQMGETKHFCFNWK
ncbi:hypothetical protein [Xenorhabdus eapokensis]|uniref:DUF7823 domain-containing protein n=1 Tax=Xenorhabdus eapokensis TaxID=1873482 RepID=A0A1Q5THJ7_9GAMM|nr:hypothetical protein [Xenorhabdus eapokensis]OKO99708.1 hypothetical protein Xedl_03591 [Xenorhabdus eapokensis]